MNNQDMQPPLHIKSTWGLLKGLLVKTVPLLAKYHVSSFSAWHFSGWCPYACQQPAFRTAVHITLYLSPTCYSSFQ